MCDCRSSYTEDTQRKFPTSRGTPQKLGSYVQSPRIILCRYVPVSACSSVKSSCNSIILYTFHRFGKWQRIFITTKNLTRRRQNWSQVTPEVQLVHPAYFNSESMFSLLFHWENFNTYLLIILYYICLSFT